MKKPLSCIFVLFVICWECFICFNGFCVVQASTTINEISEPYVPEFTLDYVDNSIEVSINNNVGASYYNFRFKGHYEDEWRYYPHDPDSFAGYNHYDAYSVPCQASNSSYTVVALPSAFFQSVPIGGEVDVQVQALFGDYRAVPYGVFAPGGATYDFYFEGTVSEWSNTQTVTFEENAAIPEFSSWMILPLFLVGTLLIVFIRRRL